MLRYITGVSLITIVLLIVRRLAKGRMLNRHRYALWLLIPIYMLVAPFLKINVTVAEEFSNIIPRAVRTVSYYEPEAEIQSDMDFSEDVLQEPALENTSADISYEASSATVETHAAASKTEIRPQVNIPEILNITYISVASAMLVLLGLYNAGFILYCRRRRNYIGIDPVSGLKIYGISHRGVPFLLFNGIYVDNDPGKISKYAICHEACHYRHGDFIWVIVRHLVLVLNWYNPIIWAAFILSGRDCELACDEEVISVFGDEHSADYAETLLLLMQRKQGLAGSFVLSSGMRSGYGVMKNRIVNLRHPAKKSYKVLAMSLAALIMISGFSVLEPVAAESDAVNDAETVEALLLSDSNTVTEVIMHGAPFDYTISEPVVEEVSAKEKDITFYRDGNAIKSKLYLPEGDGPFETIVMRGNNHTEISHYRAAAACFRDNGYAALIIGNNYDDEILARTYTGSVNNHVGDLYFEQILDIYAVIDELRYLPDVDIENLYLWGHEYGGLFAAFVGCKRQSEFRGMILVVPFLDEGQYVEFSDDPKYVGRIYEMLSECNIPAVFVGFKRGLLRESLKGSKAMPDGEIVIIENATEWYDGNVGPEIAEAALPAIKSWG